MRMVKIFFMHQCNSLLGRLCVIYVYTPFDTLRSFYALYNIKATLGQIFFIHID